MIDDFLTGVALGLLAGWGVRWGWHREDTSRLAECAARARLIEIQRERPEPDGGVIARMKGREA